MMKMMMISHSDRHVVTSPCGFLFLMAFHVLVICISSMVKRLFIAFAQFSNWIFFKLLSFESFMKNVFFCILALFQICGRYVVCKYILPVYRFSFHCLHKVFHTANIFNFDDVPFINFSFDAFHFIAKSKNSLPLSRS